MRIVGLWDTHIDFDIKGRPNHINLTPIFRFIRDFKPQIVVLGGDMHDWTAACHWIANQSLLLDGQSIKRNFRELHSVLLNPLKKVMPRGSRMIYLSGNHEDWLMQTMYHNRNGLGYWRLEDNIDLKKYNMTIIPVNKHWSPNRHLTYIHGLYTCEHHAKKTVMTYHCSVFYGHTHDQQSHTIVSPVSVDHFYAGKSVGCLCKKNPGYVKNRPNRWVNGFHYNVINDNGLFHDTTVTIVKGRFYANGKLY